jgi:nitrogen fixation-related uncharacterized protein|tara:strand:+ start:73 stop:276 length:204 start_codon:yes stop_codon:yes gene_type:complete
MSIIFYVDGIDEEILIDHMNEPNPDKFLEWVDEFSDEQNIPEGVKKEKFKDGLIGMYMFFWETKDMQ